MITINIFNLLFYILGGILIWNLTPEQYRDGLGFAVSAGLQLLWLICSLILFFGLGMNIMITLNFT